MNFIDLRSDTVTLPTKEMLEAICTCRLGDDVFREDPTVNILEEKAAKMMGKEAALLVASGTMANLVSIMANTNRGESAILESDSHIYWYEVGGISAIAGILPLPVNGTMGVMSPEDIEAAIRTPDLHIAETKLVCIENTHNRAGGTIVSPSQIEEISKITKRHGLTLYMDGARIFNAAVASRTDIKKFTRPLDNMMFCLSKGLCCPAGSILVGKEEFIERARRIRKVLGGGMRQAGVIAAPGIIALEKMVERLEEDHKNARFIAKGIAETQELNIDMNTVQTNMVVFSIDDLRVDCNSFVRTLKEHGLLALSIDNRRIRMVTHWGISREDAEKALSIIEENVKYYST